MTDTLTVCPYIKTKGAFYSHYKVVSLRCFVCAIKHKTLQTSIKMYAEWLSIKRTLGSRRRNLAEQPVAEPVAGQHRDLV